MAVGIESGVGGGGFFVCVFGKDKKTIKLFYFPLSCFFLFFS